MYCGGHFVFLIESGNFDTQKNRHFVENHPRNFQANFAFKWFSGFSKD